jgi:hypothetical protein
MDWYSAKVAVWGRPFDFERGKGCHFLISWPSQDLNVDRVYPKGTPIPPHVEPCLTLKADMNRQLVLDT